jgi:cell division protein ZapB
MRLRGIGEAPGRRQHRLKVLETDVLHEVNDSARLDPFALHFAGLYIVATMSEPNSKSAIELELKRLEKRLDELVGAVGQLKEENRALRQRQDSLSSERASLLQKNEQVRARVEAMIGRLKSMEQA